MTLAGSTRAAARPGRVSGVLAVVAACALAIILAVVAGDPVSATTRPGRPTPKVTGADLPTIAQVAARYPYLRGGSREVNPWPPDLVRFDPACVAYTTTKVQPVSSRLANYAMRDGQGAYFSGRSDPYVGGYRFRSPRHARAAFSELRGSLVDCYGYHPDPTDPTLSNTTRELRMPRIGSDRIAVRRTHENTGDAGYFLEIWVRRGRFIVDVTVQNDYDPPGARPAISLARAATRAIT